jgi:hypothetical protein
LIDAPRYGIEKLLAEHVLARNTLRQCRDEGRPFVLFLRSFWAETTSAGTMTTHSRELQDWLAFCLLKRSVPIIKLFGGSDGVLGPPNTGVLSAHGK